MTATTSMLLVADQLDQCILVAQEAYFCIRDRRAEHEPEQRGRGERRAAAELACIDPRVPDLVDVIQIGIRPHDEVDFLVVERHDDPQRAYQCAGLGVAAGRLVQERLVHVRLDDCKLDAGS
jgi:hypothetical protein